MLFSTVCVTASEDQYICVQGQQTGCVNVPPYCSADNNIEENWEDGIIYHFYCYILQQLPLEGVTKGLT